MIKDVIYMQPSRCYILCSFRQLILNIDFYTMMIGLDKKRQHFVHNYQNIMIMKELQKHFGKMYLGKKISIDVFFILENLRINCHIDTG